VKGLKSGRERNDAGRTGHDQVFMSPEERLRLRCKYRCWFTEYGSVGSRTDVCQRCGMSKAESRKIRSKLRNLAADEERKLMEEEREFMVKIRKAGTS
jgi:hypothetical protein